MSIAIEADQMGGQVVDAFGYEWANAETRAVQGFLRHTAGVCDEMLEAARQYFHSPRACRADVPVNCTFAEYAENLVAKATSPDHDPGHDSRQMLRLELMGIAVRAVDWDGIAKWWRIAVNAELYAYGCQL